MNKDLHPLRPRFDIQLLDLYLDLFSTPSVLFKVFDRWKEKCRRRRRDSNPGCQYQLWLDESALSVRPRDHGIRTPKDYSTTYIKIQPCSNKFIKLQKVSSIRFVWFKCFQGRRIIALWPPTMGQEGTKIAQAFLTSALH